MEQRFKFIAPTPGELAFAQRGKPLLPLAVIFWLALNLFHWPTGFLKLAVGLVVSVIVVWLVFRLSDIQRREAQAKYGSVKVTSLELRVSLSERSLLRIRWPDFKGTEVKNGWLQFGHRDVEIEQGGQSRRLDRVRLRELEAPDALIEALSAQTLAPR